MTMPRIVPKMTPSTAAAGATIITSRAPAITREKHVATDLVGAEPMGAAGGSVAFVV